MKVKLSEIHASTRVRKSLDTEKLDELAESFGEIGQLVPVMLRPNDDGYQVVFGHRRVDAARQNGEEEIEAIVRELDDTQTLIAALAENVVREDMNHLDVARAIEKLKSETGWSNEDIAKKFGWSERTVRMYLDMLKYKPEAVSGLGTMHVYEAKAGTGNDPKLTEQVLEKASEEGLSRNQTRHVAEEVRRAAEFDGEKGVKATLKKPYTEMGRDWLKKHDKPIVDRVEGKIAFEWLKQPEVQEIEFSLKLISKVVSLMARKEDDRGTARHILKQWRGMVANILNQIDEVLGQM